MEESTEQLASRFADAILPFTVCLGVFMILGLLGNIVVLCVYLPRPRNENERNNFRIFVINFAIVDLFVCAILFPTDMFRQSREFNFHSEGLCMTKNYINNYGAVACALSLMIISIDRTRKVLHPMKIQMSKSLAVKLCVGLSVFSLIVNVPIAITSGVREANKTNIFGNQTLVYMCGVQKGYEGGIVLLITRLFHSFLLATVSISTIIMYVTICCVQYKRNKSSIVRESTQYSNGNRIDSKTARAAKRAAQNHGSQSDNAETRSSRAISEISSSVDTTSSPSAMTFTSRVTLETRHSGYFPQRFPVKTMVWGTLTFIFIVTNCVSIALAFYMSRKGEFKPPKYALVTALRELYYINSIVNPFIYFLLNAQFRQSCASLFKRMLFCKTSDGQSSENDISKRYSTASAIYKPNGSRLSA